MLNSWPKLSETLPYERHPDVCQNCGGRGSLGTALELWRECDEEDRPTAVCLNLCEKCAKRIIEPHPRLYMEAGKNCPAPGAMPHLCADCSFRDGLACRHPDLKANGGSGLSITGSEPFRGFIDYRGRGGTRCGHPFTMWPRPATACAGRKVSGQ